MLVTPGVAAAARKNGIVPLAIEGELVPARIVGVVPRYPSIVGDAVVADRQTAADGARHALAGARHDRRALGGRAARKAARQS